MQKLPTHSYTKYTGKPYIYYAGSVYDTTRSSPTNNSQIGNKVNLSSCQAPVYQPTVPMISPVYQPSVYQPPVYQPTVPSVYQPSVYQPTIQPPSILPNGELVNKDVMYLYYANVYGGYTN